MKGLYIPAKYPKFDTFDAIEISRVKDIPKDYNGLMAVPITFLDRWDHSQFQIMGKLHYDTGFELTLGMPIMQGKRKYARILIRLKDVKEIQ